MMQGLMTPERMADLVAGSPYPDLTPTQLMRVIDNMFEGASHGTDYIVGRCVDPVADQAVGRAFLVGWKRAEDEPSIEDIDAHVAANEHLLDEPDAVIIVPSVTLWERMSDDEAEQVEAAMASQPFRTRQIFMTAQTFRSDHELWPLLQTMATTLFGKVRAGELLATG